MAHYQRTNERRTICKSYNAYPTFTRKVPTVSAQISHDHMATAFHFLISNLGGAPVVLAPALATGLQACQTKRERESGRSEMSGDLTTRHYSFIVTTQNLPHLPSVHLPLFRSNISVIV